MTATIGSAWSDAVRAAGGRPGPAAASATDLERRYAEPHRRYHTAAHVQAVLRDTATLGAAVELAADEQVAVTLAACAHDVVYDARPGTDERDSADWAVAALRAAGVGPTLTRRVEFLVLTTLTHEADPADTGAGVLLDADLAVLAGAPNAYAAYVRAVRAEYAAVSEPQWRTGRAAVLSALLDRPRLYLTGPGRARWESTARANVGAELAQLAGTP